MNYFTCSWMGNLTTGQIILRHHITAEFRETLEINYFKLTYWSDEKTETH